MANYTTQRLGKKLSRGTVVVCAKCGRRGVRETTELPLATLVLVVHEDNLTAVGDAVVMRSLRDFCSLPSLPTKTRTQPVSP